MANNEQSRGDKKAGTREDLTDANSDHQNIAPNRGGRADMGSEQVRPASGGSSAGRSGITTKKSVTGSDYDGQVSESN